MSLSTSNSKLRRSVRKLAPVIICLATFAVLLMGWKQLEPSLTEKGLLQPGSFSAFREEVKYYQSNRIIYDRRLLSLPEVLFVGDSRVGFDIIPVVFAKESGYSCEIVTYPLFLGGQLLPLLEAIGSLPPRRVIIGVSPGSLYWKQTGNMLLISEHTNFRWPEVRAILDNRLDKQVHQLRCQLVRPFSLTRTFARMGPDLVDEQYQEGLEKDQQLREESLARVGEKITELTAKGWQVALVRMPISPSLLAIETAGFPMEKVRQLAAKLKVPYLDFSKNHDYNTMDGSHLTGIEAEDFTFKLAQEMHKCGWLEPK